jgi:hypothetical protein
MRLYADLSAPREPRYGRCPGSVRSGPRDARPVPAGSRPAEPSTPAAFFSDASIWSSIEERAPYAAGRVASFESRWRQVSPKRVRALVHRKRR